MLILLTKLFLSTKKVINSKSKLNKVEGCHEFLQLGHQWFDLRHDCKLSDVCDTLETYSKYPFFTTWRNILLKDTIKINLMIFYILLH